MWSPNMVLYNITFNSHRTNKCKAVKKFWTTENDINSNILEVFQSYYKKKISQKLTQL